MIMRCIRIVVETEVKSFAGPLGTVYHEGILTQSVTITARRSDQL